MANEVRWSFRLVNANDEAKEKLNKMIDKANERKQPDAYGANFLDIFDNPEEVKSLGGIPKWNFIEDCEDGELTGRSAWAAPEELFLEVMSELVKVDPLVAAVVNYDDEYLDFAGCAGYFGPEEVASQYADEEEIRDYVANRLEEEQGTEPTDDEIDEWKWEYLGGLIDESLVTEELKKLVEEGSEVC